MIIYVHFGMPKTGSTSIQSSLFEHLDDPRFHYVNFGQANSGRAIHHLFKSRLENTLTVQHLGYTAEAIMSERRSLRHQLDKQLAEAKGKTAILSAEGILGLELPDLAGLHAYLSQFSDDIRAIAYVRPPAEYIVSAFSERIKISWFEPERIDIRYRNRFKKFDDVFGAGKVELIKFDPAIFQGDNVVLDFCARTGIRFSPDHARHINERLSLPAIRLLATYRKWGPGYGIGSNVGTENKRLTERLKTLSGPRFAIHPVFMDALLIRQEKDIAWMENRLGTSLRETRASADASAINCVDDLFAHDATALEWLATQLGADQTAHETARPTPQQVAQWMHELRLKLSPPATDR